MQRWLTVAVASLGIVFAGADAPPSTLASQSVTIYNPIVNGEQLTPLQAAYVSAKIGQLLDARGTIIDRSTERADEVQKFGDVLCSNAKTALLLVPSITSSVSGRQEGTADWNTIRIELLVYDCAKHVLHRFGGNASSGFEWTTAANNAINDAVKHYVNGR